MPAFRRLFDQTRAAPIGRAVSPVVYGTAPVTVEPGQPAAVELTSDRRRGAAFHYWGRAVAWVSE